MSIPPNPPSGYPPLPPSGSPGGYPPGPYGYPAARIRFDAINESWRWVQAQMSTWVAAALIAAIINSVIWGVYLGGTFAAAFTAVQAHAARPVGPAHPALLVSLVFYLINPAAMALCNGGLLYMAVKQLRGEPIGPGDLFGATRSFGKLYLFYLIFSAIGFASGQSLYGGLLALPVTFILYGLWMFAPLLIIDRNVGLREALGLSWRALRVEAAMAVVFYFVASLVGGLGFLACCVGALVTYPMFIVAVTVLYRDYFPESFMVYPVPGTTYAPTGYPYGTPPPLGFPGQSQPGGYPEPRAPAEGYPEPPAPPAAPFGAAPAPAPAPQPAEP